MPTTLLILLILAGVAVGILGSPRASLWVLVSTWLLVPGGARLPGVVGGPLFIHRVILVAVAIGLVRQLLGGKVDRAVFAVRGVHGAFALYLAVAFLNGVLLAESRIPYQVNTGAYLNIVEQAGFFVVALAMFRLVGARQSAAIITTVVGALAGIALSEHLLTWSYTQWFVRHLNDPEGLLSLGLGRRGPNVRVRASATFALELGWMAAMLIPLTAAVAAASRRATTWVVPMALTVAMIWSWSRSAYLGLAAGAVVWFLGAVLDRPRRLAVLGLVGLAAAALLVQGALHETLDLGAASGERDVRFDRLPAIFQAVADRPVSGLGLGGLLDRRVRVVDISWVNTYATLGVLGAVALAALLLTAIHAVTRFTWAGPSPGRMIAAGAAAATVVAPIGMLSYDLAMLRASTETLWGLTALSLVANEELGILPIPAVRRRLLAAPLAVGLGLAGLLLGIVLAVAAPARSSIDATFTSVAPRAAAHNLGDQPYINKVLSKTACDIIDGADVTATVHCQTDELLEGGIGTIRIESPDAARVQQAYAVIADQLHAGLRHSTLEINEEGKGRPGWATTAPVWLAAAGAALGSIASDKRSPLALLRGGASSDQRHW